MAPRERGKHSATRYIVLALMAASSVAALGWMLSRFVSATAFLLTPISDAATTSSASTAADRSLEASLPLFLLDNGSVAVSNSSGYVAVWDAFHAHFAGLWAAASEATMSLTVIAVLATVLLLCIRLFRGVPFTPTMTRLVGGAGIALIAGGALAQLFSWFSRQEMIAAAAVNVANNGWRLPSSAIPVDLVPLACGAVLLIMALAFSAGTRMQRDTEGLV
jgi:hypothetical protein